MGCRFNSWLGSRFPVIRFSVVTWFIIVNNHYRGRRRRIVNNHHRSWLGSFHNDHRCRSRHCGWRRNRTAGIRCPGRRYRTHTAAAPDPGAVIPVPILITGHPDALPPAVTVFRNHDHRLFHYHSRRRRWNHIDFLLRRKEYIIQIAEEYINTAGVGTVVDHPPRNVGTYAGASGEGEPDQGCT